MTGDEIKAIVLEELGNIAPEADLSTLESDEDIREALDMDSMDVMNLVIALHNRLNIDIPEADATKLVTVDGAVGYLTPKLKEA